MNKLFVANLPWSYTDENLRDLFGVYGQILSCKIIKDRETGKSKGFGFVEFAENKDMENALQGANGTMAESRPIIVKVALPYDASKTRS